MADLSAREWEALVAPHFRFLETQFGFRIIAAEDADWWATSLTYASDRVAVIVRYSVEFSCAEVELVRLVDGGVPPVPIFVHPETSIDRCTLDNLLLLRAPTEFEELRRVSGLDRQTLERSLALQARALEHHANAFLRGDVSVFDELDRLIKSRVAKHPQKITISLPRGTPQIEIDRAVAQAKKVDPRVPVEVQFYERPTTS